MKKIVLLPLDERPCNYEFPYQLFQNEEISLIRPKELGDKKISADTDQVIGFLLDKCKDAYALVIAMDTLLYGGLIPSRLHQLTKKEVTRRLEVLRQIRKENPELKIYAFQCIMRCPVYSSSDEEPDYYGDCGKEIHLLGEYTHRIKLGYQEEEQKAEVEKLVPEEALKDYLDRRAFNLEFNLKTLDYLEEGIIDFLLIPQDDSAPFGYTAMDQEIVRARLVEHQLYDRVLMYPGADEIAMTLVARVLNEMNGKTPKIYIKYASCKAQYVIPLYEDRFLGETLKYHILAAGCETTESYEQADIILAVNAPAKETKEAWSQPCWDQGYQVERNMPEFYAFLERRIKEGRSVAIADNAYGNGAELDLIAMLDKKKLLMSVAGYAGWNTSSNTIGTTIAESVVHYYYGKTDAFLSFLALRYVEDAGYCACVRAQVTNHELAPLGFDYFNVKEQRGIVSQMVWNHLDHFIQQSLGSIADQIKIESVWMPWRRMFEVGLHVTYQQDEHRNRLNNK